MRGHLRNSVSFAIVGDKAFFLDLQDDRYFCLGPTANAAFVGLACRQQRSEKDQAEISALATCGLPSHRRGTVCYLQQAMVQVPTESLEESCVHPQGLSRISLAICRVLFAQAGLKMKPLHSVLDDISRRKSLLMGNSYRSNIDQLAVISSTCQAARAFLSHRERCLSWSIAVINWAIRIGCRADLIIAVRDHPFAAHCWVQCGAVVVNDSLENVRNFTPILVI